ncbi:MAG: hypothetical protein ACRDDL_06885 [Sarcina sp.]
MDFYYNLGGIDIFRNLKIIMLLILVICFIKIIFNIKSIYSNLNSDIKVTVLDNLINMSTEDFNLWINEYLESREYKIIEKFNEDLVKLYRDEKEILCLITRKYSYIDLNDAKYLYGMAKILSIKTVKIITTGEVKSEVTSYLDSRGINVIIESKKELDITYDKLINNTSYF